MHLKIGTRSSSLSLCQTYEAISAIHTHYPNITFDIVKIKTSCDIINNRPLYKIGGKGLFLKEIENALLKGEIDIAVHSMKDVPSVVNKELIIDCILPRIDARDVFISYKYKSFSNLPKAAKIATSSPRRRAQLLKVRSDINVVDIRGNIDTRIEKLKKGQADALILAAAGLKRLKLEQHINHYFQIDEMLPTAGQGAIGIQRRKQDIKIKAVFDKINDLDTFNTVQCEKLFLKYLNGDCSTPIAVYSEIKSNCIITLKISYITIDGKIEIYSAKQERMKDISSFSKKAAEEILKLIP